LVILGVAGLVLVVGVVVVGVIVLAEGVVVGLVTVILSEELGVTGYDNGLLLLDWE
jgi:hypothetical protein